MDLDRDDVVAEVSECFYDDERALVERDLTAMATWFEQSDLLVRFGRADRQRGSSEIEAWRSVQPRSSRVDRCSRPR